MTRFLLTPILLITSFFHIHAQTPAKARFEEVLYDFGVIKANDGIKTHDFHFKNVGNDTLVIDKIKVSDPSLIASSNKLRYGPGEMGKLTVNYKPKNENGKIVIYISLMSNDSDFALRQLTVKADVVAGKRTIEDDYPAKIGNLRFKSTHLSFDQVKNHEVKSDTFRIYNAGNRKMTLSVRNTATYIQWSIKPSVLEPGKSGWIALAYNAPQSGVWGLNYESFILSTNDSLVADKTISVGVNIVEDFSKLTVEQKNNPPKIEFAVMNHDFGDLKQGAKVSFDYSFQNKGKSDLIIRRSKASCGCTVADPDKLILKPGEESFIRVSFDATGLLGDQQKTVMVVSNDPAASLIVLTLTARVKE